ncbi:protein adenylyltransferase SelO family protein [uncultured Thiohalocapsa sp.]|uniref:protein adenylyltransferase SelO family protein n=1 Tax=uncultured Thiohalocapsa sp. TaxID=768990 RepID=UPI0025FB0F56|nr:protein adenylyltransferase SelO family protein [uncultured Thiohalocapsa sp.]
MPALPPSALHQPLLHLGPDFFTELSPRPLTNPELVACDPDAAALIGLAPDDCAAGAWLDLLSGRRLPRGCRPLALDYAGHQFGRFNPFLGDGRVLVLGSIVTERGRLELSLKGAGRTPYAREADGRAGLTECLHELDLSRRLAGLGIPTARCLCVIAGDEQVDRGGFERAAILVRLAPSHLRFGTFENCFFKRDTLGLRRLADYLIAHHCAGRVPAGDDRHAALFRAMVLDTADLIAHWQAAGFTHGMMNTDNQSAVGVTLDLGAAAFVPADGTAAERDAFVASPLDDKGRYAFGAQPTIGLWNCNVLARALSPIIPAEALREALRAYEPHYLRQFEARRAARQQAVVHSPREPNPGS